MFRSTLIAMMALVATPVLGAEHSQLWGVQGEAWTPDSRLPDFSYAGYGRGERPLPTVTPQVNIKDFGARGDGQTNDTAAFRRAVQEAAGRAIHVPAGKYVITDMVTIDASRTVLCGDGPDRSVLYFPKPLQEVRPKPGATSGGKPTSMYSFSGGFLELKGSLSNRPLSEVTTPARRGEFELVVEDVKGVQVGDDVRLTLHDTSDNSLARHLYAEDSGPIDNLKGRLSATFLARVVAVKSGPPRVQLDRPLRWDVRLDWKPRLYSAASSVEEAGIEHLAFEFPVTDYDGHFKERGFNAIELSGVHNCWARNIVIRNADSGIFAKGHNLTLTGIVIESRRRPDPTNCTGHHGVTLTGTDCLFRDFEFRSRFIHDVTVSHGSAGNVTMNGRAVDLALDHHCRAPHANLYTQLDGGLGSRLFFSGGDEKLGWHCGAWETFWNIRTEQPQRWPGETRKPWSCNLINLIGLSTNEPSTLDRTGRWLEAIRPDQLSPPNLYEAQLNHRKHRARKPK